MTEIFTYRGRDYELRVKHGEITGEKLFSVSGMDTWSPSPEDAISNYAALKAASESGYYRNRST